METGFFAIGIIVSFIILFVWISVILRMYRKVFPNRALVVTGFIFFCRMLISDSVYILLS